MILAPSASSIPIRKLAVVMQRPSHVLGVHFFDPVPVLKRVPSPLTANRLCDTVERARAFVEEDLGKNAIDCQDRVDPRG